MSGRSAWPGRPSLVGSAISSPAVVNGVVYVGSADGKLAAFDADASTGCSGTPKLCTPLWTATTGGSVSSPAVVNGVVYVGSDDHKLYAFDAAGVTGCSGAPKSCTPLWTATTVGRVESAPTVVNGVVYVGAGVHDAASALYAFDAAGVTGCAGTPKTCAPLWKTTIGGAPVWSSPTVVNGVVYVGYGGGFFAFDAASGAGPMWTGSTGNTGLSSPAVAHGIVYINSDRGLFAFDAAGVTGCSATILKQCAPLWTTGPGYGFDGSSPAVANGVVYVGNDNLLYAVDAASGALLWSANTGVTPNSGYMGPSPAVANGVVYVGDDNLLYAFDAAGVTGCSGSPPKTCAPLRTAGTATDFVAKDDSSPTVANGVVYLSSSGYHDLSDLGGGGTLNAYSLP